MNSLAPDSKYLTKPYNRNTFDKVTFTSKSNLSRPLGTPKNSSKESNFKASGALTARTMMKEHVKAHERETQKSERKITRQESSYSHKNSSETSNPRVFIKKLRTKSRGEFIPTKENSSNSSKVSNKCQSSISKSNSRKKEKIPISKHQKKKSAAIPRRSTTSLYANKSEYEKRNSKAVVSTMKPSASTAILESKLSNKLQSKFDLNIKYPAFDKDFKDSSYQKKRESYNVIKSSRDNRVLIEFKLHDDESTEIVKTEDSKDPKNFKSKLYQTKFNDNNLNPARKPFGHKLEHKADILKPKYGKPIVTHSYKPKKPSISIDKSASSSKLSRYEFVNKPR
jgi:hypothetical protein